MKGDTKIIDLIFYVKKPERIIIISDTVKASKVTPASCGIRNEDNGLLGRSITIKESAERLIQMGLDKEIVIKSIPENPERYLKIHK
jgi:hypothetical protein